MKSSFSFGFASLIQVVALAQLLACSAAQGIGHESEGEAQAGLSLDPPSGPQDDGPPPPPSDDPRAIWQRTCVPNDLTDIPQRYFIRPATPGVCAKKISNDPRNGAWKLAFKTVHDDGVKECLYAWSGTGHQDTAALDGAALHRDGAPRIQAVCTANRTVHPRTPNPMGSACSKCAQAIGPDLYVDGSFFTGGDDDAKFRAHTESTSLDFLMTPGADAAVIEGGATTLRVEDGEWVDVLVLGSRPVVEK